MQSWWTADLLIYLFIIYWCVCEISNAVLVNLDRSSSISERIVIFRKDPFTSEMSPCLLACKFSGTLQKYYLHTVYPEMYLTGFVMFFWFHSSTSQEILNFEKDEVLRRICSEHLGKKFYQFEYWALTYQGTLYLTWLHLTSKELSLMILKVLSTSSVLLSCV